MEEGKTGKRKEEKKVKNLSKTRKVVHYLQNRNRLINIENKFMATKRER